MLGGLKTLQNSVHMSDSCVSFTISWPTVIKLLRRMTTLVVQRLHSVWVRSRGDSCKMCVNWINVAFACDYDDHMLMHSPILRWFIILWLTPKELELNSVCRSALLMICCGAANKLHLAANLANFFPRENSIKIMSWQKAKLTATALRQSRRLITHMGRTGSYSLSDSLSICPSARPSVCQLRMWIISSGAPNVTMTKTIAFLLCSSLLEKEKKRRTANEIL